MNNIHKYDISLKNSIEENIVRIVNEGMNNATNFAL